MFFSDMILELPFTLTHPMPDLTSKIASSRASIGDDGVFDRYSSVISQEIKVYGDLLESHCPPVCLCPTSVYVETSYTPDILEYIYYFNRRQ
jgi:hypothetical protein